MPFCPNCGKAVQEDSSFCPNCGKNLRQTAQPQQLPTLAGGIDPDASTARTLTLIAIILQIVFFAIGIFAVLFFFAATLVATATGTFVRNGTTITQTFPATPTSTPAFVFGILGLVFAIGFVISVVLVVLDYVLVYRNLGSPNTIPAARNPALILGILQLLFGGLIPGILLIIAYLKIGDSMRRNQLAPR